MFIYNINKMVNYQNSKIYRLVCNNTGLTYYGSTCNKLSKRLVGHRGDFNSYNKGLRKYTCTSFEILKNDNFDIILVENCPCNTKEELHARERYYIENNVCVNKFIPNRTKPEYHQDKKEHLKEYIENYRKENVDKLKQSIECKCGSSYLYCSQARHFKTQKHIKYQEQNKNI